jgi:hypothetical protein
MKILLIKTRIRGGFGKTFVKIERLNGFQTGLCQILSTPPSTTYINMSQIGRPWLSRLSRGLYGMAHKLDYFKSL